MERLHCHLDPGQFASLDELHAHITREHGSLPAFSCSLNPFLTEK